MIDGVKITPLKKIKDDRGSVLHMIRKDSKNFISFGEIYFSIAYPKAVKAWHLHKETYLNYACISGAIKLVLFDDRPKSRTKNEIQEIILSIDNYFLVTVPPLIWNGFTNIGKQNAILANCSTVPYRDEEIIRKSPFDKFISYKWS
jgi:dTDP-4-dehydrorhamnose 3,5-epimerase